MSDYIIQWIAISIMVLVLCLSALFVIGIYAALKDLDSPTTCELPSPNPQPPTPNPPH